jgi:hypothetical protein
MRCAGHILGAATVEIVADGTTLVCSGDLGRPNDPLMYAPELIEQTDYLLVESTYGDRKHPDEDPEAQLADVITRTALRHGITLVPSFAVGRAQLLMYHLYRLMQKRAIPDLPIYLNSPMATDVTLLYQRFRSEHRLSLEECEGMCHVAQFVRTTKDSIELDLRNTPAVIIAASGMATGGRVIHHLKTLAPNPVNTLLVRASRPVVPEARRLSRGRLRCGSMARMYRSGPRWSRCKPCPPMRTPTKSCNGCAGSSDRPNTPMSCTESLTLRMCADASAWSWVGRSRCRNIATASTDPHRPALTSAREEHA